MSKNGVSFPKYKLDNVAVLNVNCEERATAFMLYTRFCILRFRGARSQVAGDEEGHK
jgi:hypothetical protein